MSGKILKHNVLGDIIVMDKIGRGGYATIYKGYCIQMKTYVCLKIDEKGDSKTENEFQMMSYLNHPLTCQCFGVFEDSGKKGAIIEFIDGQTILDFVNERGIIKEISAKFLFLELISIIYHLHIELHMIHQDLKCENVIIDKDSNLHLIDFGFAHIYNESAPRTYEGYGTPGYIPPEVIKRAPFNYKSDIFSIGILLYAMLVGKMPFVGASPDEIFYNTCNIEPYFPASLTRAAVDLLRGLLSKEPQNRPDILQIMAHPWLNPYIRGHLYKPSISHLHTLYVLPEEGEELDPQVIQLMSEYNYDINVVVADVRARKNTRLEKEYIFLRKIQIAQKMKNIQFSFFIEADETRNLAVNSSATGSLVHSTTPMSCISQTAAHSIQPGKPLPIIIQPKRKVVSKIDVIKKSGLFI